MEAVSIPALKVIVVTSERQTHRWDLVYPQLRLFLISPSSTDHQQLDSWLPIQTQWIPMVFGDFSPGLQFPSQTLLSQIPPKTVQGEFLQQVA